jgi:hypothetical protein
MRASTSGGSALPPQSGASRPLSLVGMAQSLLGGNWRRRNESRDWLRAWRASAAGGGERPLDKLDHTPSPLLYYNYILTYPRKHICISVRIVRDIPGNSAHSLGGAASSRCLMRAGARWPLNLLSKFCWMTLFNQYTRES